MVCICVGVLVAAYRLAEVDPIASVAGKLVKWMNSEMSPGLKRCAEVFAGLEDVTSVQLLWVDAFGCDMRADLSTGTLLNNVVKRLLKTC